MRQWLREIRKSQRYSQREIAEKAGISQSYFCFIEKGGKNVNVETAMKIAKALDFPWTRFYEDKSCSLNCANESGMSDFVYHRKISY